MVSAFYPYSTKQGRYVMVCRGVLHPHLQNMNIICKFLHLHHFFTIRIRAAIIQYLQIGNEHILNDFFFLKKIDRFLVFWACFENIMQY
jgi:hypothetical protein